MNFGLRPFQVILIGIFAFLAFVSIFLLSQYRAGSSAAAKAYGSSVVIWGTLPQAAFNATFQNITQTDRAFTVVSYHYIDPKNFSSSLLNAIAQGNPPDLVVLPSEYLVKERPLLQPIPYSTLPLATFRNLFVDGAQIFARSEGVDALPFAVDPLVMYWNRDRFASAGLAQPPTTWEDLVANVVPKLTHKDARLNIQKSAIAFGETSNIKHADSILMMLDEQSGSAGVTEKGTQYVVGLNQPVQSGGRPPLEAALQFYTDFSNVNSPVYSWNRAMPEDEQAFTSGDLALYFGFGSEAQDISNKNPNLNFDVAPVPQGATATTFRTYGTFYGFAIPRAAHNPNGAYAVAQTLLQPANNTALTKALNMASARRDVVAAGSGDLYRATILKQALIAESWLDPDPTASASILAQMVDDVTSGRSRVSQAVNDAIGRLVLKY